MNSFTPRGRTAHLTVDEFRRIALAEARARVEFKAAKAERFIDLLRNGTSTPLAWQEVAADPELHALEVAFELARVELVIANFIAYGMRAGEFADYDEPPGPEVPS